MKISRLYLLDHIRGILILGMIFYHTVFVLQYLDVLFVLDLNSSITEFVANIIRFLFIYLVGLNSAILYFKDESDNKITYTRRQLKRSGLLGLCALLISGVTFFFIPEHFVYFGVLHLLAVSVLLTAFPKNIWKIIIVIGVMLLINWFLWPKYSFLINNIKLQASIDYFSVWPWLLPSLLGIINFKRIHKTLAKYPLRCTLLETISKYALWIYMLHVPLIIMILLIIKGLWR